MLSTCGSVKLASSLLSATALSIGIYIAWKGFLAIYYHKSTEMNRFFKFMYLSAIISYLSCTICSVFGSILVCFSTDLWINIFVTAGVFSYYCVMLPVMLVTFTARLQYSFDKTILRTNRVLLGFIYITTAFIALGNLTYVVVSVEFYTAESQNHDLYLLSLRIFLLSLVGYIIVSIILVITFIRKLSKLMKTSIYKQSHSDIIESKLNQENNSKLITVVARYLVVTSFSFLTTLLVILMLGLYGVLFDSTTYVGLSISRFIGFTDVMCNMVCLYVQFAFAAVDYRRFCGCCDFLCKKMLSNSKSNKTNRSLMELSSMSSGSYVLQLYLRQ